MWVHFFSNVRFVQFKIIWYFQLEDLEEEKRKLEAQLAEEQANLARAIAEKEMWEKRMVSRRFVAVIPNIRLWHRMFGIGTLVFQRVFGKKSNGCS